MPIEPIAGLVFAHLETVKKLSFVFVLPSHSRLHLNVSIFVQDKVEARLLRKVQTENLDDLDSRPLEQIYFNEV